MKIILIGASGDIGRAALTELGPRHEIIKVGRSSGDLHADISDRQSIEAMYEKAGNIDAVVCTAGNVHFGPLTDFTEDQFMLGVCAAESDRARVVPFRVDFFAHLRSLAG